MPPLSGFHLYYLYSGVPLLTQLYPRLLYVALPGSEFRSLTRAISPNSLILPTRSDGFF